ncbi:MAG: cell division protein ZapE [Rickettsiaceae bacterium]|nr:cell division protein ZapE [Rickettsiaceae bacterium]
MLFKSFRKVTHSLPKGITLDSAQSRLVRILDALSKGIGASFFTKFFYSQKYEGIYLHGPVGTGKSIIMKAFFDSISTSKQWYHYQSFIKFIHDESHKMFIKKKTDAVETIAEKLAATYSVIIIDELEVRDITDAMIIQRVANTLIDNGCFLGFTSNIKPGDLYAHGIQRDLFMRFIKRIESNFFCYNLDNGQDYRFILAAENSKMIFEEATNTTKESFNKLVEALAPGKKFIQNKLEVFGREIVIKKSYKKVIYITVEEICNSETSYNDFIVIAASYSAIIVDGLATECIKESDKIIRLINFIDNLYENKLLMLGIFNVEVELLYKGSKYKKEYERACSRISEMGSSPYISSSKYFSGY